MPDLSFSKTGSALIWRECHRKLMQGSRIILKLPRPPSQTWKTFLHNHLGQMVSIDFFTVPTITMKVLFVFVVLEHRRREVLHTRRPASPP